MRGGWSGFGMVTVGIHPTDFELNPTKIPPGGVVKNCLIIIIIRLMITIIIRLMVVIITKLMTVIVIKVVVKFESLFSPKKMVLIKIDDIDIAAPQLGAQDTL